VLELASKSLFEVQVSRLELPLLQLRRWRILSREYPTLELMFGHESRPPLRLRLVCDNWNELPPSIELLDQEGNLLSPAPRDPAGVFNPGPHPMTQKPFICMRGAREYHTHPSHLTDHWDSLKLRSDYDLGGILTQVWRAWSKALP
jgi:Predicted metal binding domain